ncbi:aldose 1-epimerase family protein [Corynebacterium macginleyi]|uniref:aldose 1-epimerase family protein n=1 Tax=Corynebacterium macginleyi TaxID=38290 RepID=UPI001F272CA5|nr:aldose 1-epimerase family protein [Corynebacterium macginleyi]
MQTIDLPLREILSWSQPNLIARKVVIMTGYTANEAAADIECVSISEGDYIAEVALWGGGLKSLTFQGQPLLETYKDKPPMLAGVVLAPWPNRTADGQFTWKGEHYQLDITEPELNNAIHGLAVNWWKLIKQHKNEVTLTFTIGPHNGWPWTVELKATYAVDASGLHSHFEAVTEHTDDIPFAYGLHLFLSAQASPTSECVFNLNVDEHHLLDERKLPTGQVRPAQLVDIPLNRVNWDDCFHGQGPLVAEYTADGRGVRLVMDRGLEWVQLYTPDSFPRDGDPSGKALAVEPMSAPPNALRNGIDLARLTQHKPQIFSLHLSAVQK